MDKKIRIGIDVGGTFTDFVLVDEQRDLIYTGKRLTTSGDPSEAITAGTERLLRDAGLDMAQLAQHRARHHAGRQHGDRAQRREDRADHDQRAFATRSRSGPRSATISTICFSSARSRWCRVTCVARSTSGSIPAATVLRPLDG